MNIVEHQNCQEKFGFMLPSSQLEKKRKKKLEIKYKSNCDMYIWFRLMYLSSLHSYSS